MIPKPLRPFVFALFGGAILASAWRWYAGWPESSVFSVVVYFLSNALASLMFVIAIFPWNAKSSSGRGIESFFTTALAMTLPAILPLDIFAFYGHVLAPAAILVCVPLVALLFIEFKLIGYHLQDHDPMVPGYFSENLYLNEDVSTNVALKR